MELPSPFLSITRLILSRARWDLGLRDLRPEWRRLLRRKHFEADVIAGLSVACVAIPLSLAIALASGVPPQVGLVTAVVAGAVCALFGGTPLAVSGPAAAMAVLIAAQVERFGLGGLLVIGLGCGLLQLLTGVLGLGSLIRFVPLPVIAGFTAGIGAIILIGQLPRVLGLPPPDQSHVLDVLTHIRTFIHDAQAPVFILSLVAITCILGIPRLTRKVPAVLVAVVVPTILVETLGWDVPRVGAIPNFLPWPSLPALPNSGWGDLLAATFAVFVLATLETLLSSSAADKLAKGDKHDPDQELIGQGLGNVTVSVFGGIPVTGVIARTALNIQAGARTRRSALIHAGLLLVCIYWGAEGVARIPLAALAGVLVSVALRMLNVSEFKDLWYQSKSDAVTYAVTFFTIVFFDLIWGVQAGFIAAFFILAVRVGWGGAQDFVIETPEAARVYFKGVLTFLSALKFQALERRALALKASKPVVLDFSATTEIDASAFDHMADLVARLHKRGTRVVVLGLKGALQRAFEPSLERGGVHPIFVESESDLPSVLTRRDLEDGLRRHGLERPPPAAGEKPAGPFVDLAGQPGAKTFFISCSEGSFLPGWVADAAFGEMFVLRNFGNFVPPAADSEDLAVAAALEFALNELNVTQIIVCGHARCRAVKTLLNPFDLARMPALKAWLDRVKVFDLRAHGDPESAARLNVVRQIEYLSTHPAVRERLEKGGLSVYGWFYDSRTGIVEEWSEAELRFRRVGPS